MLRCFYITGERRRGGRGEEKRRAGQRGGEKREGEREGGEGRGGEGKNRRRGREEELNIVACP